jgi:hypothetical protein
MKLTSTQSSLAGPSKNSSAGLSLTAVVSTAMMLMLAATSTTSSVHAFISPLPSKVSSSKSRLYYDVQRDPPNENVWSVLANTEKWIASTLKSAEQASSNGSNPLSRKEVSYVCETSQDSAMILANIFRKLKEARQLGETHGQEQEEMVESHGKKRNG